VSNNIPIGLSNNNTDIDMSAIIQSSPDYAPGDDLGGYASEEWDIERQTPEYGNDLENIELVPSEDRKHVDAAQKGLSIKWKGNDIAGTANKKASRKKKQKKDEFAEIVQAEELT
jgi:hypothetical protein